MKVSGAVAVLAALAQETRLEIVRLLIRHGRTGLPAGQIAEQLGLVPATLSFHLNVLSRAGMVRRVRESRQIIYTASFDTLDRLTGFLMENCCSEGVASPARPRKAGRVAARA